MSALYLDASAVVAVLFDEPTGTAVSTRMDASARLVSSRLLVVEVRRLLARLTLDNPRRQPDAARMQRSFEMLIAKMDLIEIDATICASASRIAAHVRLRALDAIHLASFQHVRNIDPSIEMLTFDRRMLEAIGQV